MKRKTLPSQILHPKLCWGIWVDNPKAFGGQIDRVRKRRATYLMRTMEIVI